MTQEEATKLVNKVFASQGQFLMRYAYRKTGSAEVAEDLVQEVFLARYRDLRMGKEIREAEKWAFGAIRNQIRKRFRDSARHAEELVSTEELDLVPSMFGTPDLEDQPNSSGPLGLSVLSAREEEVVLLRLQSLKYREIGERLGIGTKSVCTLLSRAIAKLQNVAHISPMGRHSKTRSKHEGRNALQ